MEDQSFKKLFTQGYHNDNKHEKNFSNEQLNSVDKMINLSERSKNIQQEEDFSKNSGAIMDQRFGQVQQKEISKPFAQKKASKNKPFNFNKLPDKEKEDVFENVYDENIHLRVNLQKLENDMKLMNTKLHQVTNEFKHGKGKIQIQNDPEKDKLTQEISRLKEQVRLQNQAKKSANQRQGSKGLVKVANDGNPQTSELLRTIDFYKNKFVNAENQIKSMQQSMIKNPSIMGAKDNDIKNENLRIKAQLDDYKQQLCQQQERNESNLKQLYEARQNILTEKNKSHNLEKEKREYELKYQKTNQLEDQLALAVEQKEKLEYEYKDLCKQPFMKEHINQAQYKKQLATTEEKLSKLQNEYESYKTKCQTELANSQLYKIQNEQLNQSNKQYIEEIAMLKSQIQNANTQYQGNMQKDIQNDDEFMKKLGTLKWNGEKPSWLNIDFIPRPQHFDNQDPKLLLDEIKILKQEKADLAAQLDKTQTLLRLQVEIDEDFKRVSENEKKQFILQLKGANAKIEELTKSKDLRLKQNDNEYFERNGVKYDCNVSEFSVDTNVDDEFNYLDLFIGEANLDENSIRNLLPYQDNISNLLSFLTIDFYNHDTVHTGISEGLRTNYDFQVAFKVTVDEFLIMFLETEVINFELYISTGTDAIKIANSEVTLKEMVLKNDNEDISAVVSCQATFRGQNNQNMGIMDIKFRMRFPIAETIKWIQEKRKLGLLDDNELADQYIDVNEQKKILIKIDKASGLSTQSNTFVFYNFCGKDVHTLPQKGQNPIWNHLQDHTVLYNQQFRKQIQNYPLELTLFDDYQPLNSQDDFLGTAKISLKGLLENEIINKEVEIKGPKNERVGLIYVKIFWFQSNQKINQKTDTQLTRIWEEDITIKITNKLRSKQQTLQSAFKILDMDGDKVISANDFKKSLVGFLNLGELEVDFEMYYQTLPQPLNEFNFGLIYGPYLVSHEAKSSNRKSMSNIKSMLNENSNRLLQPSDHYENDFESGKPSERDPDINSRLVQSLIHYMDNNKMSIKDLFNKIDDDNDGYVSLKEIVQFLSQMKYNLTLEEKQNFFDLFDQDHDQLVSIQEFFDLFKAKMQPNPNQIISVQEFTKNNKSYLQKSFKLVSDMKTHTKVSKGDFKSILKNANPPLITDTDIDLLISTYEQDGQVNFVNFLMIADQKTNDLAIQILQKLNSVIKKNLISVKQAFQQFDTNKDGQITLQEFSNTLLQLNIKFSQDEYQILFNYIKQNENQVTISYKEFSKALKL